MTSLLDRFKRPSSSPLAWASVWPQVPLSPGVYWFLDASGEVLYVGKAKNLKNRITSYYHWKQTRDKTRHLVLEAKNLKFEVLESELEALLVEAELIRLHQPPYNILLKDDKTPLYVLITDEPFPKVLTVRKKEFETKRKKLGTVLGPFASSFQLREVLEIARQIFPWCNQRTVFGKPCFFYHLDLCPGVCSGEVSQEEYHKNIEQLKLFLRGKKKNVVREIELELKEAVKKEEFEKAALLQKRVETIRAVTEKKFRLRPDVQLPKLRNNIKEESLVHVRRLLIQHFSLPKIYPLNRIECYDVSNIQGTSPAVSMVVCANGEMDTSEYRLFNIRTLQTPNDFGMLQEALQRRQNHPEWGIPDAIVIDGGKGQLRASLDVLRWNIPVISLAKDPDRVVIPHFSVQEKKKKYLQEQGRATQLFESGEYEDDSQHNKRIIESFSVLELPPTHPALVLLQRMRDEAHRFAKKQFQRLHKRTLFT